MLIVGWATTASAVPRDRGRLGSTKACQGLDPDHCLLPFPSDVFTVRDARTDTGRRVAFPKSAMPANASGVRIDPTEWNRSDGFSPLPTILAFAPGVDPAASGIPPVTDIGASLEDESAVVLLDTDTGERVPLWGELDAHAPAGDALLIVHPARALAEGHRHVVALRGFVDGSGAPLEPKRRSATKRVLSDLQRVGVERDDLYLAWDFTVASAESLAGRLLHMRDDAFDTLGDRAPAFTVESVTEDAGVRVVRGTFEVPSYLTGDGGPGSTLNNGDGRDDPLPRHNGTLHPRFVCTVPTAATRARPARWALFGHGLLGDAEETVEIGRLAAAVNAGFCGADWIGMSKDDLTFLADAIGEVTKWRAVPDRLQQAHLDFLVLGRLVRARDGFSSNAAFQDASGAGVIDRSDLFFVGGSQGGILGGATSAVATDWTRAFLAVPGINYSLLLPRSSAFAPLQPLTDAAYTDPTERPIVVALMQMLWDRGENSAYAQHLTSHPYAGTPKKKVLLFEAFGDFQVANVSTEILARTIGARVRQPALEGGRSRDVEPLWGLEAVPKFPYDGTVLVVWDYGTPPPPVENVAPTDGADPHRLILTTIDAVLMASEFLQTKGRVIDPCPGQPCRT